DRAMSDAYSSMIRAGVGWVEVSREFDPLRYPYRVREVHRNDIYRDWTSREPDLSDARYLRREKWVDRIQAAQMFPEHSDLIENSWSGWNNVDVYDGSDTGMARAYEVEQTWGRNQDDYLNRNSGMVRLSELWYRHHEDGYVLVLANGKAIQYREDNPYHQAAIAQGLVQVQKSLLSRMRVSIWLGPHKLLDVPSPLPHLDFPYVPFWCFRKDRSRAPYGLIRDMRGPQDQIIDLDILLYEVLNSVKVEVDNDALDLSQNTYQEVANNISSLRSMTVLNAQRRNAGGFKVIREHQLAAQVFQLMQERKRRIEEVGGIYRAMLGADTSATSGIAISSLVEQGSTVLAEPNDNFRYARRMVGQQLLALIKQDMLAGETTVAVKQGARQKIIYFNRPVMTNTGPSVENDIASAQVKVVLEDIPATPSFRAQQLHAFTQIVGAAPPQYQAVLYPAMLELSDVPNRHELADQLRKVGGIGDRE
ncbi:MAG TPA: phage portal protein, partial [Nitrosospira sp.]